ncbi:hypothetical protein BH23ACT11_BH23ACT11_22260 [soil metagenome]
MEERGLVGLEARSADGTEIGRISEVLMDEDSGELTHVVVERDDQRFELPITSISLDPEADFATFQADQADEEPVDPAQDDLGPGDAAPLVSSAEDQRHEGQLVTEPASEVEAQSEADLVREDWEDEANTPVDSGYPRTDAYIDPNTGDAEVDPAMNEGESVEDDAVKLLNDTDLEVRAVKDGVIELNGATATQQDLEVSIKELMGLDGVRDVDTTDVDVG